MPLCSYAPKFLGICFCVGTRTKLSLHIGLLSNLRFFSYGWSFVVIWSLYGPIFGYFEVLWPCKIILWSYISWNMFWFGYGIKIEPSYQISDQFAIFLLGVVIFFHLEPVKAHFRAFWGPTTLQNAPMELNSLEYVFVWERELIRAFILDFRAICGFSLVGGHWLSFGAYMGLFLGILRSYNLTKSASGARFLGIYFVVGSGTN